MIAEFDMLMEQGQTVADETFGSRRDDDSGADSILNWNGKDYHGTFDSRRGSMGMEANGYEIGFEGRWSGGKSQFDSSPPKQRSKVTVGGHAYQVVEMTEDTSSVDLFLKKQ